jgi:hypothetical protein
MTKRGFRIGGKNPVAAFETEPRFAVSPEPGKLDFLEIAVSQKTPCRETGKAVNRQKGLNGFFEKFSSTAKKRSFSNDKS